MQSVSRMVGKLAQKVTGKAKTPPPVSLSGALALGIDAASYGEAFARTQQGWTTGLDSWQIDFLRSSDKQIILNCSRQSGKSSIMALLAVHTVTYRPNSLVLVVSPRLAQAKELFRRCLRIFKAMGKPVGVVSVTTEWLELANGARIVCLPDTEDTTRGYSDVTLLLLDEAARVADATYVSLRPMLAVSGGRLVMASTPNGRQGFFSNEWRAGADEEWRRYEITADQCPRITKQFLEQERRSMSEAAFMQEYFCEFREKEGSVFSSEDIMALQSDTLLPLFPELLVPPDPEQAPAKEHPPLPLLLGVGGMKRRRVGDRVLVTSDAIPSEEPWSTALPFSMRHTG
jgi:hypothetical protein